MPFQPWTGGTKPKMTADTLSPGAATYIAARVRGKSREKAAALAGVSARNVYRWEQEAWFDDAMDRERARMFGDKQGYLLPRVEAATLRLDREIAGEWGPELAHNAAVYVLDQVWGKATAHVSQEVKGDPTGIVEVLREIAAARQQLIAEGTAEIREAPPSLEDSAESASFVPKDSADAQP